MFWISDLTIELHHWGDTSVLGFNGTTEWALDSVDLDQALLQCEYLRESVGLLPIGLPISVSIGLAVHRAGEAPGETLRRADAALYQAKAEGRDRVVVAN